MYVRNIRFRVFLLQASHAWEQVLALVVRHQHTNLSLLVICTGALGLMSNEGLAFVGHSHSARTPIACHGRGEICYLSRIKLSTTMVCCVDGSRSQVGARVVDGFTRALSVS